MNLVQIFINRNIEGLDLTTLEAILKGTHKIKNKTLTANLIILDNNKMIRCVKEYYKTSEYLKIRSTNTCFYIQKNLLVGTIPEGGALKCPECHLACIENYKNGLIARK